MLINRNDVTLLLIDIQEKLINKIHNYNDVVIVAKNLVEIFSDLDLSIVFSEQYPKGLGHTIESIQKRLRNSKAVKIEKTSFSCVSLKNDEEVRKNFATKQILICGIEAHICVLQTAVDLHKKGYEVFVMEEAVGSRSPNHKCLAFERLKTVGVTLINFEMFLFELIRDSNDKIFKDLSKYIIK